MAASDQITLAEIGEIIAEVADIPAESITLETTLSDLGIDSFAFVEIIEVIERRFDLGISDDEYVRSNPMAAIIEVLRSLSDEERAHRAYRTA